MLHSAPDSVNHNPTLNSFLVLERIAPGYAEFIACAGSLCANFRTSVENRNPLRVEITDCSFTRLKSTNPTKDYAVCRPENGH